MKTKIFTRFLATALLLLGTLYANAQCSQFAAWKYVVPIAVTNNQDSGLSNFQVQVNLPNTAALVENGHMNANGTDIRFADGNCNNLYYWIENGTFGSSNCTIWVKTKTIPASGSQTINMYYGNTAADTVVSNGDSTFDLFEDFNSLVNLGGATGNVPDTAKWTTNKPSSVTYSTINGICTIAGTSVASATSMRSRKSFSGAIIFESDILSISGSILQKGGLIGMDIGNSGGFDGYSIYYNTSSHSMNFGSAGSCSGGSWVPTELSANASPGNTTGIWGVDWPQNNVQNVFWPGGNMAGADGDISITSDVNVSFGSLCSGKESFTVDWLRVRKYVKTPPGVSVGDEFSNLVAVSGNELATCIGSSISVPYTTTGAFNADNVFTAQLSDGSGSFSSPYNIGTVSKITSGTISATLPSGVTGNNFTIRILSSDPLLTGAPSTTSFAINPLPTATISGNTSVCYGSTAPVLSVPVSNTSGLAWSLLYSDGISEYALTGKGDGTASITASNTATTTYTLESITETNGTGCSNTLSASSTVTVNAIPTANAGSNATIANGSSASIGGTAVSGSTYSWTSSPSGFTSTDANPSVTPSATTTYTLTETNANGCTASNSVTVTVKSLGVTVTGSPLVVCAGSTVNLTAKLTDGLSGVSYQWNGGDGPISGATSSTYSASKTGKYSVTITNGSASYTSSTVSATVAPLPTATISGGTSICYGATAPVLPIKVGSTGGYKWSLVYSDGSSNHTLTGLGDSPNPTTTSITASNTATTTYTLVSISETSGSGCSSSLSASATVTVNALPAANAGSNVSTVNGSSASIGGTAVSGSTYSWTSDPSGFTSTNANPSVAPSASTTYTVTEKNASGCTSSNTVTVSVDALTSTITAGSSTTFCDGGDVVLTAGSNASGASYQWSNGDGNISDATSSTYTASASGNYYVTATNGTASTTSSATAVTVNALPTASISGGTSVCYGATAPVLSVAVGSTDGADWSLVYSDGTNNHTLTGTGNGTASITASNSATTTYSLVSLSETSGNGCSASPSGSATVTVNALPAANAGSNATVVNGSPASIGGSAVSGSTYSWTSDPSGFTSTDANPTVSPSASTTYTMTETNANGCSASNSATVSVDPLTSTITAGSSTTFCAGGDVVLTAGSNASGASYQWSNGDGNISDATSSTYTASASGNYYVTATNGTASTTSSATSVTVNPLPTASISGGTSVCYGTTAPVLSVAVGSTDGADWSLVYSDGTNNHTLTGTGNGTASITASNSATTTYSLVSLSETSGNGCSASPSGSATVTVNALPAADAGSNATVVNGSPASIGASAVSGSTYSWTSSPSGFSSTEANPTVSPSASTTYTMTETNTNGCSASNSATVSVDPLTSTITAGSSTTFCAGGDVVLTAGSNASGASYQWSNGDGNISDATSSTYTASASGNYYVTATNGTASTTSSATAVTVNALPTASISGGTSVCYGTTAPVLSVAVGSTDGADWSLVYSDGTNNHTLTGTGNGTASITASNSATTTYSLVSLSETSGNGCSASPSGSATVTVNALPAADAGSNATVVNGSSASIGGSAVSGSTYSWTSDPSGFTSTEANPTVSPSASTTYTVTEKNASGCTSSNTVTVTVDALTSTITAGSSTTFCAGGDVVLTAGSNASGASYQWSNGDGNISDATSSTYTASASGNYYVTATNGTASTTSSATAVTVNALPTASISGGTSVCYGTTAPVLSVAVGSTDGADWSLVYSDGTNNHTLTGTGNGTASITASNSATTTYSLVSLSETSGNGCSASPSGSATVTVNALPAADAGSNATVVNGSPASIGGSAVSGSTYAWTSDPSGFTSTEADPTVSPSATTTYSVTETNANGCTATNSVKVTVLYPSINVQGNSTNITAGATTVSTSNATNFGTSTTGSSSETYTIQNNGSAALSISSISISGTNASDFTLSNVPTSVGANSSATFTVSFSNSSNGTYNGTVTISSNDPNTSSYKYAIQATEDNAVNVSANGSTTFCDGGSVTLSVSGKSCGSSSKYQWSNSNGKINGATSSSYKVTVAGTYYVTVTNTSGYGRNASTSSETSTGTVVTVNALPSANAGSSVSVCPGSSATLGATAVSGSSYAWYAGTGDDHNGPDGDNDGDDKVIATTSTITVNPTVTTYYTLVETNANGCSAQNTVTVTMKAAPTANAGSDQSICSGTSVQIGTSSSDKDDDDSYGGWGHKSHKSGSGDDDNSGSGKLTYSWASSPSGFTSSSAGAVVTPSATTTYSLTVSQSGGCSATSSATITVKAMPSETAGSDQTICSGGSATLSTTAVSGDSYTWYINSTSQGYGRCSKSNEIGTGSSIKVSPSTTTSYYLIASNGNCSDTSMVTVNVMAPLTFNAGSNQTICSGTSVSLGSNGNTSGLSFAWTSNPSGFSSSSANPTVSPSATTTYSVTVKNSNGCSATSSATITVKAMPTETAGADKTICSGGSATLSTTAVSGDSYTWYINSVSQGYGRCSKGTQIGTGSSISVSPSTTTSYYLLATNGSCSDTDMVTVNVMAPITFNAGDDHTICNSSSVSLGSGGSTSGLTFAWTSSPSGFTSASADPTVTPKTSTTYTVTVKNSNGCSASSSATVTVSTPPSVPTISASGSTTICGGGSVTLTSSNGGSGSSYAWSNQDGPLLCSGYNTSSIKVSTSGTYYVTVTNKGGCSATSKGTVVTVNPTPVVSICGDQTYNYGYDNNVTVSASCDQKGASFGWTCGGKSCSSYQSWTCSPSNSCSYTCTAIANGCASTPVSCNVNVHDCHDYNYSDRDYPSKCSMCYYDSHKRQYCQTYVYKTDVSNDEKGGYVFSDCGSGSNISGMAVDEINIYPNPFTSATNIRLNFVQDEQVKVEVVSMEGRVISTLYDGNVTSGTPYNFTFDGTPYQSGIYLVRVISGSSVEIRKINLLKN